MFAISRQLEGNGFDCDLNLTNEEIQCFRYAPIINANIERSFSSYSDVLSDKRHNFIEENLRNHLIVYYNNKKFSSVF